ncbi:MAG: acyl dehydratase [Acidimicrobiia bacterium]
MSTWMKPYLNYDSVAWDDVAEGDEIPAVVRPVDASLVVLGAVAASRDVYPVHHDVEAAKAAGAPDVFVNILTSNGLMAAYVTNWCGPDWDLRSIELKLLIPAFPGQKLTTTGKIARKYEDDGRKLLDVEFVSETDFGPHCKGSATVAAA